MPSILVRATGACCLASAAWARTSAAAFSFDPASFRTLDTAWRRLYSASFQAPTALRRVSAAKTAAYVSSSGRVAFFSASCFWMEGLQRGVSHVGQSELKHVDLCDWG
eukprot:3261277-Pyramimonas_sp.AAC.2